MTRLPATYSHSIPERPPIEVAPGQRVRARRRDTEWPEFVFVTAADGAGWVPVRRLDTSSDPAVVLADYDTTELATHRRGGTDPGGTGRPGRPGMGPQRGGSGGLGAVAPVPGA